MNKKISIEIAVGLIIIIALVFGGSIWLQNQKDNMPIVSEVINPNNLPAGKNKNFEIANPASEIDIANWKTYKNEKYGFEFKYPQSWDLKIIDPFVQLISLETKKKIKEVGEYPSANITITFFTSVKCMLPDCSNDVNSLLDSLKRDENQGIIQEIKATDINGVSGYEAVQLGMAGYYTLYIENKTGIYEIQFNLREEKSQLTEIENKILSSFKLIN